MRPKPVMSRFSLGDMTAVYLTDEHGQVGFSLLPASRENDAELLGADFEQPIQLHLRGDGLPGGYVNGVTLAETSSRALRFRSQSVYRGEDADEVRTALGLEPGGRAEAVHVLRWKKGSRAVECFTEFKNTSDAPLVLELLSSFNLSGLTPFGGASEEERGLATDKMILHRARSWWSAEGRIESRALEDMHMEPSWSLNGVRIEKFHAVGSMPVREFFPFAAAEDPAAGVMWAAQLACPSSWQIEVRRRGRTLSLTGSLADYVTGHWQKTVVPGEKFTSPSAYLTVGEGGLDAVSQRLLDLHEKGPVTENGTLPVIYNEYCATWGNPTEENVARAARSLEGHDIDTFVIDAGWYGSPQWWSSIGDWDVSEVKFPHGIAGTAKTIRDAGMRPGLWFELECATAESELAKNHPDWLLKQNGVPINTGRMFLDMENPAVRAYLKTSVIDFLRDNGFGYLKIDYNDTIGLGCDSPDGLGEGLRRNMLASQDFFREIFAGVPGIQIEICSSGGHRLEPSMLNLGTFSSFSDAHECVTIPVIAANLHRLMQPSKSEIWAVLRASDSLRRLNYSLVNTMLGVMCLSGDFAALNEEQLRAVDRAVAFYRGASPVIRDGESAFFCPERQSYQHPEGWQAVVRRDGKSGKTLAVLHTFGGELPPEVTLPVPGGTSRIEDTLCSENNEIRLTDEGLVIPLHANFEAVAVLLS